VYVIKLYFLILKSFHQLVILVFLKEADRISAKSIVLAGRILLHVITGLVEAQAL
jgi:hypothetical protein